MSIGKHGRELSVAGAYLAVLAVLALLTPSFFHSQYYATWLTAAPILVAGIGMTMVILARHIDVSIGWQMSICAVIGALAAKSGLSMPMAVLLAMLSGAAMGAVNGTLVAMLGFPSIVVTLATRLIFQQSLKWAREGQVVGGLPHDFQWFGASQAHGRWIVLCITIVVFAIAVWSMRWLAAGRTIYAVGSDAEAARLAGVRPRRVVFGVFVLMGAMAGLAAILASVRSPQVDPNIGNGRELEVIAAVVVGGTAISGGRGTMFGTLLGVALLGIIGPALGFLSDHAYWNRAVQGAIILAAVASDGLSRRGAST